MSIYPALDIIDGHCVRLQQGDFARQTTYHANPQGQAATYRAAGADWLHLVDLDGARQGRPVLHDLIRSLAKTGLHIQTGGGIRNGDHVDALLSAGAARVVVGSLALDDPALVQGWLRDFGPQRLVLALDVRLDESGTPRVATAAWRHTSPLSLWSLTETFQGHGARHVLCTDIDRDGLMQGPALELYRQCRQRFPAICWQASGGVSRTEDIRRLRRAGMTGVIIGKALLQGTITLEDALTCWRDG